MSWAIRNPLTPLSRWTETSGTGASSDAEAEPSSCAGSTAVPRTASTASAALEMMFLSFMVESPAVSVVVERDRAAVAGEPALEGPVLVAAVAAVHERAFLERRDAEGREPVRADLLVVRHAAEVGLVVVAPPDDHDVVL